MDYNSKINWHSGMEITSKAMRQMDSISEFRSKFTLQLAMGAGTRGVVPDSELSCNPAFVGRTLEIVGMKLTAVLPSGALICIDEDVTVKIDKEKIAALTNDTALVHSIYLCVSPSEDNVEYEVDSVPYIRPTYRYDFYSEDEVVRNNCMPIARLLVADGSMSLDENFIIPTIMVGNMSQVMEFHEFFQKQFNTLSNHPNLETSDLRVSILQAAHQSAGLEKKMLLTEYVNYAYVAYGWLIEYLDDYAKRHKLSGEKPEIPELVLPNCTNLDKFFASLKAITVTTAAILDISVIEDHSIDFEALKAQLKAEIMADLNPEIDSKIEAARIELHDQLMEELEGRLRQLTDELMEQLRNQLRGVLYEDMYQPLYDALYNALKDVVGTRPVEVLEDDFMPMI